MARKKDLAGLAALGALGYALSRGKGDDTAPTVNTTGDTRDYGVDYSEAPQRGRDFMTEKEPAENFSERKPTRSLSAAPARPRPRSVGVATAGNAGYDSTDMRPVPQVPNNTEESMRGYKPRRIPQIPNNTEEGMRGYRSRADSSTPMDTSEIDRIRRVTNAFGVPVDRRDEAGRPYKKGGAVKSKASAPKASSASRRADGIATKGKTRGRYL